MTVKNAFIEQHESEVADQCKQYQNRYEAAMMENGNKVYYRYNELGDYLEKRVLLDWESDANETLKKSKQKTEQKYWDIKEFYYRITPKGNGSYILQLENEEGKLSTLYFDEAGLLESKSKSGGY